MGNLPRRLNRTCAITVPAGGIRVTLRGTPDVQDDQGGTLTVSDRAVALLPPGPAAPPAAGPAAGLSLGLLAQVAVLVVLAAGAGLGPVGWLAGVAYALV